MYIQDVGEVHVGVGKMWVPQFGDLLDGIFEGMTGCLQMEMLMRDSGRDCDVACGAMRWEAKLRPKRTSLLSRRLIGCLDRALHHLIDKQIIFSSPLSRCTPVNQYQSARLTCRYINICFLRPYLFCSVRCRPAKLSFSVRASKNAPPARVSPVRAD